MSRSPLHSLWRGLALATTAALLFGAGCGSQTREARLQDAQEHLAQARERLDDARMRLAEREKALEQARQARQEALEAVTEAEGRVAESQAQVQRWATDEVLFRTVQKALLESDALQSVAIRASVSQGVVTLLGEVPDAKLRDRAVAVAKEVPGVVDVRSQITVQSPEAEKGA